MKKTIQLNATYKVSIKKHKGWHIAHIYENNSLLAGTNFNINEKIDNIIDWAKNKIISISEDLFPHYELLPARVQEILEKYEPDTYTLCDTLLSELKPFGYTFEYYLDATPFNLTKIA